MRRGYNGVKFYGSTDLSCGYFLEKAEAILQAFSLDEKYVDINRVIELFNIKQFFDCNIRLKKWEDNDFEYYRNITENFIKIVATFFAGISNENFVKYVKEADDNYLDNFWFLNEKHIRYILEQKNIVYHFGQAITECMMESTNSAELLIFQFLQTSRAQQSKLTELWFPQELDEDMKEQLLKQYINSPNANPNFLKLIATARSTSQLRLQDKTKLTAKKDIIISWNPISQKIAVSNTVQTFLFLKHKKKKFFVVLIVKMKCLYLTVQNGLKIIKITQLY